MKVRGSERQVIVQKLLNKIIVVKVVITSLKDRQGICRGKTMICDSATFESHPQAHQSTTMSTTTSTSLLLDDRLTSSDCFYPSK